GQRLETELVAVPVVVPVVVPLSSSS
ncbi:hypothetical protein A2U01_0104850, partial [Trifolium medium]|nr:hypothetical protein [Trifolium medium]